VHQTIALKYLQDLCDTLENNWDADYTEGALLIQHIKGQFLLNYHGTMDQIWFSSPITGAHHFSYRSLQWLCTRTNRELESVLRQDLDA
jgi:frataxin-like iron-binding protein CyaY